MYRLMQTFYIHTSTHILVLALTFMYLDYASFFWACVGAWSSRGMRSANLWNWPWVCAYSLGDSAKL